MDNQSINTSNTSTNLPIETPPQMQAERVGQMNSGKVPEKKKIKTAWVLTGGLVAVSAILALLVITKKVDVNSLTGNQQETVNNGGAVSPTPAEIVQRVERGLERFRGFDDDEGEEDEGRSMGPTPTPLITLSKDATFKDGTYTQEVGYDTPAGTELIKVTVTLKDGVITDSVVVPEGVDRTSVFYQQKFVEGYKPLVVGKKIVDVNLGVVSGSSLTPIGFNVAIQKIELLAKS